MSQRKKATAAPRAVSAKSGNAERISLAATLQQKAQFVNFGVWIIGDTPLITHAWDEKARRSILAKQVKAVKAAKEARDPEADFRASLYDMGDDTYGFPAMGFKNALLSSAHKDRGIARTDVMSALWIDATLVRTRPALAGAICDMPLLRIYGSDPEMREDPVKIGAGLRKVSTLAYRAQFTIWAVYVTGSMNPQIVNQEALAFLIDTAGKSFGLGEWRNERKGMFGSFHRADAEETEAWDAYRDGEGELPVSELYRRAAE